MTRLAQKAKGGSDSDLAEFQRVLIRHAAIQEQVTGATAEAGRALSSFRILARSRDANARMLDAVIQGGGGRGRLGDVAEAIVELQADPSKLNQFVRHAAKPGWRDVPIELFYNSILSAPTTHAINMIGNTAAMGLRSSARCSTRSSARLAGMRGRSRGSRPPVSRYPQIPFRGRLDSLARRS